MKTLPTETMLDKMFKKRATIESVDEGTENMYPYINMYGTIDEIKEEIREIISLSQNRILEEVGVMERDEFGDNEYPMTYNDGYNQALEDIIKLISKKDN